MNGITNLSYKLTLFPVIGRFSSTKAIYHGTIPAMSKYFAFSKLNPAFWASLIRLFS